MNVYNFINFRTLNLFIAVYDMQSFSLVARREDVSPSLVTRTINQLEDALGQQLFYRNTRAVIPTEAGHLFISHARTIIKQITDAQVELQETESEPSGLIRINAPVVFGHRHIAPCLGELYRRYPRLKVELQQTDTYIDPHQDGTDLLFRIGVLADSSYQARVFGSQIHYLVASPEYIHNFGYPHTPKESSTHRHLVFNGPEGLNHWYFRHDHGTWHNCSLTPVFTSNNADTLVQSVLSGMGITLFPDWLVGKYIKSGQLVRLLTEYELSTTIETQQIAALWPNTRRTPLKIRTIVDFFVEKFGTPPYWRHD